MGKWKILLFSIGLLAFWMKPNLSSAQCPEVFDFDGVPSTAPMWYSCSGNNFSFNLQSPDTWNGYTIDWGDGTPITSGATWSSPGIINHLYAATVDTYTVTITETSTGCVITGTVVMEEATSASIQIPVGGLTQACAPQMMEFINSSTNVSENTIFTWDFGDGSPPLTFDYTNWNQTISHVYQQGTVDCETEVSLTASNYCNVIQGGESEATFNPIRIWDLDDPGITASATLLCYPDTTVTFTNTTERNCLFQGNIYQRYEYWNFGDYWGLGHDSIIDWTPWPPTFPRTMHYPGIGTYTVQLLDSNFCGIAPTSITIQIVPPPVAGFTASVDTTCVGQSVTFIQGATGSPNQYWWDFGTGTGWIPTGGGNITFSYSSPGTYTVRSRVSIAGSSSACEDIATMTIVVLPNPVVNIITSDAEDCVVVNADMFANTTNAVDWQWFFPVAPFTFNGQDPPNIAFTSLGNQTVTCVVTSANGCQASANIVIRVRPEPVADFSIDNLCEGEEAHFNDESTVSGGGSGNTINSWQWNFGDGSTSTAQHPDHLYSASGTYTITLIASTSFCSDTVQQTVTVEPRPVPSISQNINAGCSPLTVQFTDATANASSVQWTFGDGGASTSNNPSHVFVNNTPTDTTYTVVFRAFNAFGCQATDTLYVTVYAGTVAAFTDNGTPPGCSPFLASFTNNSINASSYLWNFGDGNTSTLANPTHLFTNSTGFLQSIPVTLIAYSANGCHDTLVDPILIYPQPDYTFDLTPFSGCSPITVTMPFIVGAQSYSWNFGDGTTSTLPVPTHTFTNTTAAPITYTVSLTGVSPFGCSDVATSTITVYPQPVAQFTMNVSAGCSPLTVDFENTSILGTAYTWDFGDGDMSGMVSPTHTFENNTSSVVTYTVVLTARTTQSCIDQFTATVTVYPAVQAQFAPPADQCSPATVFFANQSSFGVNYLWDFGNGLQSTQANPNTVYSVSPGASVTYNVQLSITSPFGCTDSFNQPVTIHPQPIASFNLSESAVCDPAPAVLENTSTGAISFNWNYDDGTFSTTNEAVHDHQFQSQGQALGSYDIVLTATSAFGCSSSSMQTFTVFPSVQANFVVDSVDCSPFNASFVNLSVGASTYQWQFGNGATSSSTNPSQLYTASTTTAVYEALLIASNAYGCVDTASQTMYVHHKPIAGFQMADAALCNPLPVELTNTSLYATTYLWNFGDGTGSSSSAATLNHTYPPVSADATNYTINLIAITSEGCSDTTSAQFTSYPFVEAAFTTPPVGCAPYSASMINQSIGAQSYAWNFGNGVVSSLPSPEVIFTTDPGEQEVYTVSLFVQNSFGCTDSAQALVTVNPSPVAAFVLSSPEECHPGPAEMTNQSLYASSYVWNYGDGTFSTNNAAIHDHQFPMPSSVPEQYQIVLTATSSAGCTDTVSAQFTLFPPVVASFTTDTLGCSPFNNAFTNQSVGASSFEWSFGDGGISSLANPSHTYLTNNTDDVSYDAQLVATSIYGCTDTASRVIYVNHTPLAVAQLDSTSGCYPLNVTLYNGSIGADSYNWYYGNGQSSSTDAEYHDYLFYNASPTGVTYTIVLTAYADNGCSSEDEVSVLVSPDLRADFEGQAVGCSPVQVFFNNTSEGGSSYAWNFGDGDMSNEQEPVHTFFNNTNNVIPFEVTLVITNSYGCTDTTVSVIEVYPDVVAAFTASPEEQTWPNATIQLDNQSSGAASVYSWRMGDGTTYSAVEPGSHMYGTWGEYTIALIAGNDACSDTTYRTIVILPPPPTASFLGPAEGCAPLTVSFTNLSQNVSSSMWQFGDGGVANANAPVYTYYNPGIYTVTLTVTGFDGTSVTQTQEQIIHVYPRAQAIFTLAPTEVNIPSEPVFCMNLSQNATDYVWDFGNGQTSTVVSPSFYYQEEGIYTVTLIANNEFNCPDTMSIPSAVHAKAGGLIDFPNAFTPNPTGSGGGYYDPLGYNNDVFFPMHAGVTEYNLQIFNKWGELLFESTDVNRGWDGYYRNQMCKQDVYVWKVRARFVDGQRFERAGDVTLLIK